jgi:lysophospholipase L1-like esterase
VLFKRSEANVGTIAFHGITLEPGAKAWASSPPKYKLAMAFFGDSISVGACNEDGAKDQWDDRRTHNAALSYAAMTAAGFDADHRNISVSGMGVVTGWVTMRASEIWDRLYPNPTSPLADLTKWSPQVVFVEYGDNDESFPKAHGQPFPTNFTAGYVALVHSMRQAYRAADFVLLRGAMVGGWQSKPLGQAWDAAVAQLESEDKGIHHFVFEHHSANHPRVADDRTMADELIAWLKRQEFMRRYL